MQPDLSCDTRQHTPRSQFCASVFVQVLHVAIATFVKELRAGGPMREGASPAERAQARDTDGPQQGQQSTEQQGQGASGSSAPAAAEKVAGGRETAAAGAAPAAATAAGPGSGQQIKLTEKFYASARDIFDCFTDPRRIMAYTQSPAEAQVGWPL